jgi:hypothetical protein
VGKYGFDGIADRDDRLPWLDLCGWFDTVMPRWVMDNIVASILCVKFCLEDLAILTIN